MSERHHRELLDRWKKTQFFRFSHLSLHDRCAHCGCLSVTYPTRHCPECAEEWFDILDETRMINNRHNEKKKARRSLYLERIATHYVVARYLENNVDLPPFQNNLSLHLEQKIRHQMANILVYDP
jgi:hypothetical protein